MYAFTNYFTYQNIDKGQIAYWFPVIGQIQIYFLEISIAIYSRKWCIINQYFTVKRDKQDVVKITRISRASVKVIFSVFEALHTCAVYSSKNNGSTEKKFTLCSSDNE